MTPVFTMETDGTGVAVLTLDVPGEKHNILDRRFVAELAERLTEIENDPNIKAVVLRSGKADSFTAGADLRTIRGIHSAVEGEALARSGQELMDRVAGLRVPTVIAIHGPCLGGGVELALACRYRIVSDDASTTVALPEVRLGLIPGAGGTQRLPRLVGLAAALDVIVSARTLRSGRALRLGLVDEVVPRSALLDVARRRALALAGGQTTGQRPRVRFRDRILAGMVAERARKAVAKKVSEDGSPAPFEAIRVVTEGLRMSLSAGLRLEAASFGRMAVTDAARAQIGIFFATQEARKDAGFPEGTATVAVERLAVVGAGLMGAGIAGVAAEAGIPVRLKDGAADALGNGLGQIHAQLDAARRRGRLTRLEAGRVFDRVSPTLDWTGFRRAQFVIEAVPEDLVLKRRILEEVQAATTDDCVYGSCTSALPIRRIAEGARRPSRVVGMHFLSPVQKVPLLEVVAGAETDAATLATAVALGRRLGKHTIVVRDGPGFYTTRSLGALLGEAVRLLGGGVSIEAIDGALVRFGFPSGPLALLDEIGLDVSERVSSFLASSFGERLAAPVGLECLTGDGRLGRKNRRGFYKYDEAGRRLGPDSAVPALLPVAPSGRPVEEREVLERLVFAFLNEASFCLQDEVLRSARDGDVGAVFGLGFPHFLGGPFQYLDHLGARFAVEVLERLSAQHGPRYRPARMLLDRAQDGKGFHA